MSADLSDFDANTIPLIPQSKLAFFLLSTYGEGDPSDNTSPFWDWLTKSKNGGDMNLASVRYAAFGLGNSQYRYYNRVVDVVDEALEAHGAQRLVPVGKADDAKGTTQEDFLLWRDALFSFLRDGLNMQCHEMQYEPALNVVEDESLDLADLHSGEPVHPREDKNSKGAIVALKIKESRELFNKTTSRNCLHVELDLADHPSMTYKTGDHLAVWAPNPECEVDRLVRVLGLESRRHTPIMIMALDQSVKVRVPSPTTLDTLLRHYLEICAPVSRDTAQRLADFAPTETSKAFLQRVSRDRDTFEKFLGITHVNVGRLLEAAVSQDKDVETWESLPLSYLIETLPRMQPRYYSVSSSSVISPRIASITVLVSDAPLRENPTVSVPGLATNYLLALSNSLPSSTAQQEWHGDLTHPVDRRYNLEGPEGILRDGKVFAHIRRSKFKLPALSSVPLIMVAAGTGVAPFRAFIAERARLRAIGKPVGNMILLFGCRNPEEDYIYREELERMEKDDLKGCLRVVTAFSRGEGKKMYVQDRLAQMSEHVKRMLAEEDGGLYICGRASMAREVGKVVNGIMYEADEAKAKEWSETMKRTRKWQEDVWG